LDPTSRFDANGQAQFQVAWEDGDRVFCRGWRSGVDGKRHAVLVVLPAEEHPTPTSIDRLFHEYDLKGDLDGAWAVMPLALERDSSGCPMLMLEDPGGEPLERQLGAPMEVGRFLRVAATIASAVGKVHQRGLVHKDIKPANILVNGADDRVRLTGFGIASRLPRERQAPEPPESIAGTLAYMAPEQTGRMNRSIDSRSDLYALGITLYQMLVGRLPFSASDPMEWIHCHIARRPVPPSERLESVPGPISEIVMRLIAKTAEQRYQTAAGVEHDLRRCLREWELRGCTESIALGERDAPDRLLLSEKLYGRERELEHLLAAFDRVVTGGTPELVLVSGYSGIGKSSIVNELHKALVPSRGLFASGKFDQQKRDIPYSTPVQAFQSLVRSLLSKTDADLATWRQALLEALGPNGRLVTDLIPELRFIIGNPPSVPELEPQQSQRRFQHVLRRFIGVFARPEHPLALFLDDLQWLDAATLDLMDDLLTRSGLQHLMLIGAYRDNEIDAAHPLRRRLTELHDSGAKVSEITLGPFDDEHTGQLVADALRCSPARAAPLAELVRAKTAGNPFFVRQFLCTLADERLLVFDHEAGRWSWNLDRIHAKAYTENVLDLLIGKLSRLPTETQEALQWLACLGNSAEMTTLTLVRGTSEVRIHKDLWEAVRAELVEQREASYKFIHDRVREAAYSLLTEASRAEAHLRIGRLLAARAPPEAHEESIFEIVSQLDRAATLITAQDEREQLAELNLIAGKRAKASTAYASALKYFSAGAALLQENSWQRRHALTFALELNRAECEFLTGALAQAEEHLVALSKRAATTVERANVTCLRMDLSTTLGEADRAVSIGLEYLHEVGIECSPRPTDEDVRHEYELISSRLGSRTIEELIALPLMTDPASLATLDVLIGIVPPAALTTLKVAYLVMCEAASLSLERGNSDGSCFAFEFLGIIAAAHFGDYVAGVRLARVGYELVEQRGLRRLQARVYLNFGTLMGWTRPVLECRDMLRRTFDAAIKTGDFPYAAYACFAIASNLIMAGDRLLEVQREAEQGLAFAQKFGFGLVVDITATQLVFAKTLRGATHEFGSFDDDHFEELQIERRLSGNSNLARAECWYWIRKLQALFFAGKYPAAIEASSKASRLLSTSPLNFELAEYHFYTALSRAACCDHATDEEREAHLEALGGHDQQLKIWAHNCPANFENRAALVGAEIARILDRTLDAECLYEKAIRSARDNGLIHNEALSYELAARFYAARGFQDFARLYLRNARLGYQRWGAEGKVRQLDQTYPQLQREEPPPGRMSTIGAPVEQLDLVTVIKVSQTVSSEIVLEKLIETVMRTAIEQAGAERGVLVLAHGTELRIAVEATTAGDGVRVDLRDRPVTANDLPEMMLQYIQRTEEGLLVDDATANSPFAVDPYIRQRQARSLLLLPLLNQAKLLGVLYLENALTSGVFTPARTATLKLLASQAAISLENTQLYRKLAEREARIRRLVDSNIVGILIWNAKGQVTEANDAFLRMLAYEREDLVSGRIHRTTLSPPEWLERDQQQNWPEFMRQGSVQPFEKEYFRKDGSRVPVLVGAARFQDGGDEGVAFVLDLTERKRAEKALRESEEQWKAVFENNPVMYFMVDASGTIESVNPFGAEQLGYSVAELIGRPVQLVFHEADRDTATRNAALCFEQPGQALSWELRKVHKSGEVIWVRETGRATLIRNRTVLLIVCEDITQGRRNAEALHEVQTQLTHANRIAALGQLTASIAHEVSQPISGALSSAQAALRWLDNADLDAARRSTEHVVSDTTRAGDVIRGIRTLVKKLPPRTESFDMNEAAREVMIITRGEATKHGISVESQLAAGLPPVQGDRVQLQQVMLNLILNAIEAMSGVPEGPRELRITSSQSEADSISIAVQDSGPGLDPTSSTRLFEPFYTTKPDGLGMGLSICRSIVEAQGGRLWVNPNVPRGAVFHFSLPVEETARPSRPSS